MKSAFLEEWNLIIKSPWFWGGAAIYLISEVFYRTQTSFKGLENYYQYSYNAQFLVLVAALAATIFAYRSASINADASGFPTKAQFRGSTAADSLAFSLVVLLVTFAKFLVVEISTGGFSDPAVARFCTFSYFVYYLLQSVFLILSSAIAGRCAYTLLHSNPILTLIAISFGCLLMPIAAGVYADLIHTTLQTYFSGPYAETFYYSYTSLKFNGDIVLNGLVSLAAILLFLLVTVRLTYRAFRKEKEEYDNCHEVHG